MRFETTIPVKDGDIEVTVNPGNGDPFATVEFGGRAYVSLKDLGDCDQLIRAAVDAKRMLQAFINGTPHPFASDKQFGNCNMCGTLPGDKIHAEPVPGEAPALKGTERLAALIAGSAA